MFFMFTYLPFFIRYFVKFDYKSEYLIAMTLKFIHYVWEEGIIVNKGNKCLLYSLGTSRF